MANNYCQGGVRIPLETVEEKHWCDCLVEALHQAAKEEDAVVNPAYPEIAELIKQWQEDDCFTPGITVTVDDMACYIYDDEYLVPEFAGLIAQAFLERFDPDDELVLRFAYTCSKPRVEEFGGGAAIIRASGIKWLGTETWIAANCQGGRS